MSSSSDLLPTTTSREITTSHTMSCSCSTSQDNGSNAASDSVASKSLLAASPSEVRMMLPLWNMQTKRLFASTAEFPGKILVPKPAESQDSSLDNDDSRKNMASTTTTEWNSSSTKNVDTIASLPLGSKLAGDLLVAATVTFGVSPFLTVVDKAIVESAAGTRTLLSSGMGSVQSMVRNPVQYLKSPTFLLMWAVYSATYTTANSFKTLEEHRPASSMENGNRSGQSHKHATLQLGKVGTFVGTTFVNSGASILKDRAYARMFNNIKSSSPSTSFPRSTYAMWMMRDFSVIGSSFILPDIVSQRLVDSYGMDKAKAQSMSQLFLPVAAQFVAGPFHFLGLDFYNRQFPDSSMTRTQAFWDRSRQLYHGIGPVIMARIARIAPGYGIGGVWNTKLRTAWREHLLEQQSSPSTQRSDRMFQQYIAKLMELMYGDRRIPISISTKN
mmetsp:Transcript_4033/g.6342  ORF Transcript_4033/g.6342 Transcript_4033/m.6342 type:complete len:443 (+) Transcript_4033:219-1547(+)